MAIKTQTLSADATRRVCDLITEAARVVEAEAQETGEFIELPNDLRRPLLTLASSFNDYVFWIRHDPNEPDVEWYELEEVESGVVVHAVSPREACDRYFSGACRPGGMTG